VPESKRNPTGGTKRDGRGLKEEVVGTTFHNRLKSVRFTLRNS
jgi:hypothetical protein